MADAEVVAAPRPGEGPGGMIQQLQGPPGVVPAPGFAPPPGWVPQPVLPGTPPGQLPQQVTRLPHHRPPQHQLPAQQDVLDDRVRELMANNQEVIAVLMLGEEAGMAIIEAQEYARQLVPSAATTASQPTSSPRAQDAAVTSEPAEEYEYLGSTAIASSLFEVEDDDVWPSGWVNTAEQDDRSDINELWQSVRDGGRPQPGTEPDLEI